MEFRSNVTGRNPLQQRHHCVLISPVVGLLFDFIYLSILGYWKKIRPATCHLATL